MEKSLYNLKIDLGFKNLISPLIPIEYEHLVANIINDGCREPLVTWRGMIIDGHNRYEICHKYKIPFAYVEREFDSREDVISWICANQLGRRSISDETRRYLIGKRYEVEKIINTRRNASGVNQYTAPLDPDRTLTRKEMAERTQGHKTSITLGDEYHLSHGTVQKYAIYSKAIDTIGSKDATLPPKILSGNYKISHDNVIELSHLTAGEVRKISRKIDSKNLSFVRYSNSRREIQEQAERHREQLNGPTVKDMPVYDPDSEVTVLALTIPSWTSSINRTISSTDFEKISDGARDRLKETLHELMQSVDKILSSANKESKYGS